MEIVKTIFIIEAFLFIITFSLIFYQNIWILHSDNPKKYKWFIFNPFLLFDALFTFSWNEKVGGNRSLKKSVNKLFKFLRTSIILVFLTVISTLFI
jgi:hypothetical protein